MRDVEISDNICSHEACGVLLGTKNRIEGIRLLRNGLADPVDGFPSLLFASTSSNTAIEGLEAADNSLTVIQIRDGALSLSNASFDHNQLNTEKEASNGTCIHLVQSSAKITKSKFAKNKGTWGSCLYAKESNFTVSTSEFARNAADQSGGFSCVSDSTARFEQVEARNNIAKLNGGCVYAVNTELEFTATTVMGNRAERHGGCIYVKNSNMMLSETYASDNSAGQIGGFINMERSTAKLDKTTATENEAARGGAISLWASNATLSRTIAVNNSARTDGGFISLYEYSSANLVDTNATGNSAGIFGGCIYVNNSNMMLSETYASDNSAGQIGGFINMERSTAKLDKTTASGNKAVFGGAISVWNTKATLKRTIAVDNNVDEEGGFMFVRYSSVDFVDTNATGNSAGIHGGCISAKGSSGTITLSGTNAVNNSAAGASGYGGFLNLVAMAAVLDTTTASGNKAVFGGAISVWNAKATLKRTIAVDNNADEEGGFMVVGYSSVDFVDTNATGNSAGIHGGCISAKGSSGTITLSGTNAVNNSAAGASGYGGFLNLVAMAAVLDTTTASGNKAVFGGAISVWNAKATLKRTIAVDNNADEEGGFMVVGYSSVDFVDTNATGNSAGKHGGCIRMVESKGTLSNTTASNNSAGRRGGFLNLNKTSANLDKTTALGNKAFDIGGALSFWFSRVALNRTTALNNSATNMGGFMFMQNSSADFVDTTAKSNGAGQAGGCIFANNSTLNVSRSTLSKGRTASSGGLLAAIANSTVYMEYSMLKYGRSKNGGAMWLNETRLAGKSLSIVRCEADDDGGGIKGDHSSSLLCISCTFRTNVAKTGNGGAVSFEAIRNQSQTVQLLNCSVLNNRADLGGEHL